MARRCGNCIHKNVCELYDIAQDPTHAVGCGNFLGAADVVSRAEVEKWFRECEELQGRLIDIEKNVAREIFEEIEKVFGVHLWCNSTPWEYEDYEKLKNKYTEEGK